jgi:hypothetical protein
MSCSSAASVTAVMVDPTEAAERVHGAPILLLLACLGDRTFEVSDPLDNLFNEQGVESASGHTQERPIICSCG